MRFASALAIVGASLIAGCDAGPQPSPTSEHQRHDPRGEGADDVDRSSQPVEVRFTSDSNSRMRDEALGKRVSVEGIADYFFKTGSTVWVRANPSFAFDVSGVTWPEEVRGRRVIVEGDLASYFSTPYRPPAPPGAPPRNNMIAARHGWIYTLRNVTWRLDETPAEAEIPSEEERGEPRRSLP